MFKKAAILLKGGKCIKCGYNRCPAALDFHHIIPEEKEGNLKDLFSRNWATIEKEIDKCILLCANCHRAEHYNEVSKDEQRKYVEAATEIPEIVRRVLQNND